MPGLAPEVSLKHSFTLLSKCKKLPTAIQILPGRKISNLTAELQIQKPFKVIMEKEKRKINISQLFLFLNFFLQKEPNYNRKTRTVSMPATR